MVHEVISTLDTVFMMWILWPNLISYSTHYTWTDIRRFVAFCGDFDDEWSETCLTESLVSNIFVLSWILIFLEKFWSEFLFLCLLEDKQGLSVGTWPNRILYILEHAYVSYFIHFMHYSYKICHLMDYFTLRYLSGDKGWKMMIQVEFESRKVDWSQIGSEPNFQNLNMLTKTTTNEVTDGIWDWNQRRKIARRVTKTWQFERVNSESGWARKCKNGEMAQCSPVHTGQLRE